MEVVFDEHVLYRLSGTLSATPSARRRNFDHFLIEPLVKDRPRSVGFQPARDILRPGVVDFTPSNLSESAKSNSLSK